MLPRKVITPLLVMFLLLLSGLLAQEPGSDTKKAATKLCLEQTLRCSLDGRMVQVCVQGAWQDKISCSYGCENSHCSTKTIESDDRSPEQLEETLEKKIPEQPEETAYKKEKLRERILDFFKKNKEDKKNKEGPSLDLGKDLEPKMVEIYDFKEKAAICGGCLKADTCFPVGASLKGAYCNRTLEWHPWKVKGFCEDYYECRSGICTENTCVEESTSKLKIPKIRPEDYFRFSVEEIKMAPEGKKPAPYAGEEKEGEERDEEEGDKEITPPDEEPPDIEPPRISDIIAINPTAQIAGTIFSIHTVTITDDQSSVLAMVTIQREEETYLVLLYDDGLHDDGGSDDTKFGGVWDSTGASPGIYDVTITARDESGNEATLTGNQIEIIEDLPCREVLPGHNNLDESRANIVFVFVNYNPEPTNLSPEQFARFMLDGSTVSLAMTEPFRSNLDAFNFLYVDDIRTVDTYATGPDSRGMEAGETVRRLASSCLVPNKYVIAYIGWEFTWNADYGGTVRASLGSPDQDIRPILENMARVTAHEFGHSFGYLRDEYIDSVITLESIPITTNQCYYSPLVDCREETDLRISTSVDGDVTRTETTNVLCESTPASQEDCEANAPWRDLFGNGCGEDGVVDCPPPICTEVVIDSITGETYKSCTAANENYALEENCIHVGCLRAPNPHRHSLNTIMRSTRNNPFSYGPANQRTLCRRIHEISGTAGGICDSLCIDGCAEGQRCIRGVCTDV